MTFPHDLWNNYFSTNQQGGKPCHGMPTSQLRKCDLSFCSEYGCRDRTLPRSARSLGSLARPPTSGRCATRRGRHSRTLAAAAPHHQGAVRGHHEDAREGRRFVACAAVFCRFMARVWTCRCTMKCRRAKGFHRLRHSPRGILV